MSSRKFNWISSIEPKNELLLKQLDKAMATFYSAQESRTSYNQMIEGVKEGEELDEVTLSFLEWFNTQKEDINNILEIGCGTGRIRKKLLLPPHCHYTGTEVSEKVIQLNKQKWPDSGWINRSIYELDFENKKFDLVYSFYVLEHLVFPERALNIMFNLVKPGGALVIVCPDFCVTERFPSQKLGWGNEQRASEKFRNGKLLDGFISLYESRVRLKKALKKIHKNPGHFIVNINPICLEKGKNNIWPDSDAVYVSNKFELQYWAKKNNIKFYYPAGHTGVYNEHAFIIFKK